MDKVVELGVEGPEIADKVLKTELSKVGIKIELGVPHLSKKQIQRWIESAQIEGLFWNEWLSKLESSTKDRLLREVNKSQILSEPLYKTAKRVESALGIPNNQRWFLMNKVFGLIPTEIMEFEGLSSPRPIAHAIQTVADKIMAGELEIFKPDAESRKAAKARLEAKRAKARAYQRKRDPEKIRAVCRASYARNRDKRIAYSRKYRAAKKASSPP